MAMAGTVKFFNAERGYGFIKPDDGARDVFVHITAVERAGLKSLNQGQRISFDVEPGQKGNAPNALTSLCRHRSPPLSRLDCDARDLRPMQYAVETRCHAPGGQQ